MTYDGSETEQRLDDLEAALENMTREIEEMFKLYFDALEASHREDMENPETSLQVDIESLWTRLVRAVRRS